MKNTKNLKCGILYLSIPNMKVSFGYERKLDFGVGHMSGHWSWFYLANSYSTAVGKSRAVGSLGSILNILFINHVNKEYSSKLISYEDSNNEFFSYDDSNPVFVTYKDRIPGFVDYEERNGEYIIYKDINCELITYEDSKKHIEAVFDHYDFVNSKKKILYP